jgi:DNA polymerase
MMKREMPVRYWKRLPEAEIIDEVLRDAPARVRQMAATREGSDTSAADYLPATRDLGSLAEAAERCRGCDLHHRATQTVFGEGPSDARLMLVGEQPGDQEDQEGRPFVGPAGQLLDRAIAEAELTRSDVYVTNVVKHFKHQPRGKRRLHKKPDSREIFACRPWLEAELEAVQPQVLVCLGATAAQSLIGRDFRITRQRGDVLETDWCAVTLATWHPSAVLRVPDEAAQRQKYEQLVADLRRARDCLSGSA